VALSHFVLIPFQRLDRSQKPEVRMGGRLLKYTLAIAGFHVFSSNSRDSPLPDLAQRQTPMRYNQGGDHGV
jgi:hypothetical protein